MGDEGRLDQGETEAILFLGRDFNESFAQMRHYDGLMWDATKFCFLQLIFGVAGAWAIFAFANDDAGGSIESKWPIASASVLLVSYLFSLIAVYYLATVRTYFVQVARYINEQRDFYLKFQPLGFQNVSQMYIDPKEPKAFHPTSTQFVSVMIIAFIGSVVLSGAIGLITLQYDWPQWAIFSLSIPIGIASLLVIGFLVVKYLINFDQKLTGE